MTTSKEDQEFSIGYSDDDTVGGTLMFTQADGFYVDLRGMRIGPGNLTVELHVFLHEEGRLRVRASVIDPTEFTKQLPTSERTLHTWDVMLNEQGEAVERDEEE